MFTLPPLFFVFSLHFHLSVILLNYDRYLKGMMHNNNAVYPASHVVKKSKSKEGYVPMDLFALHAVK